MLCGPGISTYKLAARAYRINGLLVHNGQIVQGEGFVVRNPGTDNRDNLPQMGFARFTSDGRSS